MRRIWLTATLCGLSLGAYGHAESPAAEPVANGASPMPKPSRAPALAVQQYELENGLTVMLSEDHRVPTVALEILYLVGSGYERAGRTGFAHLFEHLMFQGSLHYDQDYFTPFEPIGGDVNGTTSYDRTNYFEEVPSNYAELPLWLESDRLRTLPEALTRQKLDNQRDVVRNERRQRYEITPYGMDHWYLGETMYAVGHPYRHTPIGSHEDLERATLEDVRAFFRTYYAPKNAGLVVVGDFDEAEMKAMIAEYFGDIPAGQRAPVPLSKPAPMAQKAHYVAEDQVELPRIYLAFHTPALFAAGDAELDLLSSVLVDGKSSRLFHSLVYDQKLAKDVSAYQMSQRLTSMYVVEVTAAPQTTVEELGIALERELSLALETPPTAAELERAKNGYKKDFYGRVEGYASRASLLGAYFLHTGRADYIGQDYQRYADATAEAVHAAARQYLRLDRAVRIDFIPGKRGTGLRRVDAPAAKAPGAKP
jgi:zinc protease